MERNLTVTSSKSQVPLDRYIVITNNRSATLLAIPLTLQSEYKHTLKVNDKSWLNNEWISKIAHNLKIWGTDRIYQTPCKIRNLVVFAPVTLNCKSQVSETLPLLSRHHTLSTAVQFRPD